ncbi:Fe(3+) ABC transporter substrate-binding protein [Psychroflexus maritimus]|uniref:Fe(3+) ABC transporter substrate-binding protein n=1 Tax=Psychroflexus maritimus TaxID=2714865 RepID=A0A967E6P3_9FLAO|nr:Fe(3+) ABC transporter substrate-binding protein [Psychroflexus maritimus]NGZ89961.1 Fe(3+) ABC transporter substrate-binding protein [Psychroflexus maritimus]
MNKLPLLLLIVLISFSCKENSEKKETANNKELNVYTHRHYDSDKALFELFEKQSGIKVNVINSKADELIQKMVLEGEQSPADVLITVDAGRLHMAKAKGLLQPVANKETIDSLVAPNLIDKDYHWVALTKRARVLVYAKDRVDPESLSTYEDLILPKWNDKLLFRSSSNIYNQSLMASIVANDGEDAAKKWAQGMVKNQARKPKGNDRDQVKAVAAGEGDIAIVNTYYIGKMLNSNDQSELEAVDKVAVYFPNQNDRGTHINVSGIGVAKHSPNAEAANQFIDFLLSEEAQSVFALSNYEYPVNTNVENSDVLKAWGDFKEDDLHLNLLGELNKKAVILFDEAGWK